MLHQVKKHVLLLVVEIVPSKPSDSSIKNTLGIMKSYSRHPNTFHHMNASHYLYYSSPIIVADQMHDSLTVNYAPPFHFLGLLELPAEEIKASCGALKKSLRGKLDD
jgi:hypothetical protein